MLCPLPWTGMKHVKKLTLQNGILYPTSLALIWLWKSRWHGCSFKLHLRCDCLHPRCHVSLENVPVILYTRCRQVTETQTPKRRTGKRKRKMSRSCSQSQPQHRAEEGGSVQEEGAWHQQEWSQTHLNIWWICRPCIFSRDHITRSQKMSHITRS